jgi:hypothetical protein
VAVEKVCHGGGAKQFLEGVHSLKHSGGERLPQLAAAIMIVPGLDLSCVRHPQPHRKERTRDNLIYLAVSLGVVAFVTFDLFYSDSHGRKMWAPSRFAARAVYSTDLLGYFVVRETLKLKATAVQLLTCIFMASVLHLPIIYGFRHAVGEVPGLTFSALAVPEMFLITKLMVRTVRYLRSP